MYNIIKKPLITEKNTVHNAMGIYIFQVELGASKIEIKKAIEENFKVKVAGVNTLVCRGKVKRNKYGLSKVKKWKKALVKLSPGEKIALFEGV